MNRVFESPVFYLDCRHRDVIERYAPMLVVSNIYRYSQTQFKTSRLDRRQRERSTYKMRTMKIQTFLY